jgi:hypothetical protein
MANTDKDILITPNVGSSSDDPKIEFKGADSSTSAQTITVKAYPTNSGTVSFEGSGGQLFSMNNSTSGTIFSVNDLSGVPSIEVKDTGLVRLAEHSGNVLIGTATDDGSKLQVNGTVATGTLVAGAVEIDGQLDIEEVHEKVTTDTSTTGTLTFDTSAQGIIYVTANQTANRTVNFSNVNTTLSTGQSVTCTALVTNGSTAYYLNAYQVDGTAVTPKWAGGSAPSGGTASGIDVYTFTIIKTADATFTVLASLTAFS